MEDTANVFTGKTVEEAIAEGLKVLSLTREQADIKVLEEGKKKIIGSIKAKVIVKKKLSDGERAAEMIEGLLKIMNINAFCELLSDGEKIEIDVKSTNTSSVIGRRGEVLDAIQCLAGAVANIGREEYRRVVVDCENYRSAREEKLKAVAISKAEKAVERKRRVALEPMSPYERRVIHSALADNDQVTTVSEGKEPLRRVIIIPKNEVGYQNRERRGQYRDNRNENRNQERRERRPYNKGERGANGDRQRTDRRRQSAPKSAPRAKKTIYFGTYLGNSGAGDKKDEE